MQGQDWSLCVTWSSQCGADRVEAFGTGCGQAVQRRAEERAGETHPGYEAEGTDDTLTVKAYY